MKIQYLFLILLSMCAACDSDADDTFATEKAITQNTPVVAAKQQTDLNKTVWQLVGTYKVHPNKDTMVSLQQKISLLDTIAGTNNDFLSLKPANYSVITPAEALLFTAEANISYPLLQVSEKVNTYFEQLLDTKTNLAVLQATVAADTELTVAEQQQLQFVLAACNTNEEGDGDPDKGDIWKKRYIVAAVKGFEKSAAQAVFNVALATVAD